MNVRFGLRRALIFFQSILLENLHKEDEKIVKTFLEGIEIIFIDAFVEPEYQ